MEGNFSVVWCLGNMEQLAGGQGVCAGGKTHLGETSGGRKRNHRSSRKIIILTAHKKLS